MMPVYPQLSHQPPGPFTPTISRLINARLPPAYSFAEDNPEMKSTLVCQHGAAEMIQHVLPGKYFEFFMKHIAPYGGNAMQVFDRAG